MLSSAPRPSWPWCQAASTGLFALTLCTLASLAAASPTTPSNDTNKSGPQGQARTRIRAAIDDADRVTLSGHRHARLNKAEDRGPAKDSLVLDRMILTLTPDAEQQSSLDAFIADRQDPTSPNHQQWLSPQAFEQAFGVSEQDLATLVQWLQQQGFSVDEIPAGRRSIVFSGTVRQVRKAFRTEMHHYRVGTKDHLANTTDPSIPDALSPVVNGLVSLHDFRSRPMHANVRPAPTYTDGSGGHALAAADFHTIYNLQSLIAQGNDGTGRSIAILGRTNVVLGDMAQFRSAMGLSANPPQIILNGADPGRQTGDEGESDLDLQWAGAVAPGAAIKFVTSASTASSDGVDLSAQYAVSNNVADVVSLSYGLCEADLTTSGTNFYNSLWQQATAQGMTVFVSSGDSGAADCDASDATTATRGKGVNGLCTSPYATCVGGTQFDDTANPSQYWSTSNGSNLSSALSYIPEKVWNESGSTSGGSGLWASGGGASIVFAKPSWQTGVGVPADGKRNVPDVSLSAASHDGYLVYSSDNATSTRTRYTFGGTSASAPAFAGIMALINHKQGTRQGNANPRFYQLAALQASGGPAYFHRVISGNNSVPGVPGFAASTSTTTPTYNQATGLGSVDGDVLINQWSGILPSTTTTVSTQPSSGTYADAATFTATVSNVSANATTPTGTVQFKDGNANLGSPVSLNNGTATLSTAELSTGSHDIAAIYSGNASHAASSSSSTSYQVLPVASVVAVLGSSPSSTLGQSATFTAQLSGKSVGGTLQFMDGNTVLGTVPIVSCPVTFSTSALGVGTHSITVVYSGDTNNLASTSQPLVHTVNALLATTSTTLTPSSTALTVGQTLSLSVSVSGNAPGGTVQFFDGASPLGSPVVVTSGAASLSINTLQAGSHAISASYAGDAQNAPSVSASVNVGVAPLSSSVAASSSQPTSTQGQSVTFSATVTGLSPTGTVQFMDGTTVLGIASISGGVASLQTSALSVGTHTITAVYSGDTNHTAGTSAPFVQTVSEATAATPSDGDAPLPPWATWLMSLTLLGLLARRRRQA
jgi:pseudomonalisin